MASGGWPSTPRPTIAWRYAALYGLDTVVGGSPSPAFVKVLAVWMRAVGFSPMSGAYLNLALYVLLCLVIVAAFRPTGRWRTDLPCAVTLAAVSFSPVLVVYGSQPLKDVMFVFLIGILCVAAREGVPSLLLTSGVPRRFDRARTPSGRGLPGGALRDCRDSRLLCRHRVERPGIGAVRVCLAAGIRTARAVCLGVHSVSGRSLAVVCGGRRPRLHQSLRHRSSQRGAGVRQTCDARQERPASRARRGGFDIDKDRSIPHGLRGRHPGLRTPSRKRRSPQPPRRPARHQRSRSPAGCQRTRAARVPSPERIAAFRRPASRIACRPSRLAWGSSPCPCRC